MDDLDAQVILMHIGRGADAARSIGELAEMLQWNRRRVEKAAQDLADGGNHPIVANHHGIYLASSYQELEAYTESLQRRLVNQYLRVRALRGLARRMRYGRAQLPLWSLLLLVMAARS